MEEMEPAREMWKPLSSSNNMEDFRAYVNSTQEGLSLETYDELWKWSVSSNDLFWEQFWHFSNLKYSQKYSQIVDKSKNVSEIPEWFIDSRLNYAENILSGKTDDKIALYATGEQRDVTTVTFGQLRQNVAKLVATLKECGIEEGDRVVGYIPNCSLAVEAMLATACIGGIWSSTSPEFGVSGVLDRFQQIKPKIVFSVDAVIYNGKTHDHLQKLKNVVEGLPELEKAIVLAYTNKKEDIDITGIPNSIFLSDFLDSSNIDDNLEYAQLPFNHPLYIMYSSGTTGPPKCMVHSAGGTLIQHLKEHILHGNMKPNDIMLYYTTTGWMMWNWLVSALALGSSIVLYDGSPFMPTPNVLWDLIDKLGVTVLGTGARWIEALEEKAIEPMKTHNLTSLSTILSTASPLKPSSFDYVYTSIKKDLLLGSITEHNRLIRNKITRSFIIKKFFNLQQEFSDDDLRTYIEILKNANFNDETSRNIIAGGTDIISCFAGSNPTLPVYRGEIQTRNLGMAVESWSDEGHAVYDTAGELVCLKPFPSMPTQFWNDEDGEKYQKSYFRKFPGVWAHGDYCEISSKTGGVLMLGRSDGTLNPSGVRFGSAEIYNIVNPKNYPEISDSLCVGQMTKIGERVVLFVKMADGKEFTNDLLKRIRQKIRQELSARHIPQIILPIDDIPYTASGKKVEVAVKRILNGDKINQRGAFINPDSLDLYSKIAELKQL